MSDVDAKVISMYAKLEPLGLLRPFAGLSPEEGRKQDLETIRLFMRSDAEKKIARFEDITIPRPRDEGSIPLRIYYPLVEKADWKFAVIFFFHGGGFVTGEFLSVHETCCMLESAS